MSLSFVSLKIHHGFETSSCEEVGFGVMKL
jgi:hypothetical protein